MSSDNHPLDGRLRHERSAEFDALHRTMVIGFALLGVGILADIVLT